MKTKPYISLIILGFVLSIPLLAQENITYNSEEAFVETYLDDFKEVGKGYWVLADNWGEVLNKTKRTDWVGSNENLIGNSKWKDVLSIQHTISCTFSWITPPNILIPGSDIQLSGSYVNNEYSSTSNIFSGISIFLEKNEFTKDKLTTEVLNLKKDNINKTSETKFGNFSIPKFYKGDYEQLLIYIDCYIGTDHYRIFYSYKWNENKTIF